MWSQLALAVTWQMAALAVLALVCERALRLRQPRVRHALWWFVLAAPLLLTPVRLWLAHHQAGLAVTVPALPMAVALPEMPLPVTIPEPLGGETAVDLLAAPPIWLNPAAAVALLWLAGSAALLLRLAAGHRRARQILSDSLPMPEGKAPAALRELCAEAGLTRPVALRSSAAIGSLVLYGLVRPMILAPRAWLKELAPQDIRALLAHEVAHVRRRDVLANLLQRAAEAVLFFHPGAWLASRRITLAREELCDAWALRQGATPSRYARSLAAAAERALVQPALATLGVAESRFTLLQRVEAIMQGQGESRTGRLALTALAAVVLVVAATFATVQVRAASAGGGGGGGGAQPQVAPTGGGGGGGGGSDSILVRITMADLDRKQLRSYRVGKRVSDYPDREDLSSPELAYVTINRAIARGDQEIWSRISAPGMPLPAGGSKGLPPVPVDPAKAAPYRGARLAEVWIYQGRWGGVIAQMDLGGGKSWYDVRFLELQQRRWLNRGETMGDTIAQARDVFARGVLGGQARSRQAKGKGSRSEPPAPSPEKATAQAMKRPAQFTGMARKLFESIRTADYARYLGSDPHAWDGFPADYRVDTDYPGWVKWMCTTFSKNPIVDVQLGTVFKNAEGRPTVPYRLTLKDGRVLAGSLPFYVDVSRENTTWQAGTGLDWHLQEQSQ
jgi:beta-lactamase regulating signal transducer with metallopeptidase domain